MADYQRLVASLRKAGVAAELYLGSGGMNAQLKYADRRGSRCVVIQGGNERDAPGGPQVTIRDMKLGAELAKATKDRADYLELRQRAQGSVPEAELIERVREVWRADETAAPVGEGSGGFGGVTSMGIITLCLLNRPALHIRAMTATGPPPAGPWCSAPPDT